MLNSILKKDVDSILFGLGIKNLSEEEKPVLIDEILNHFDRIIIDTIIAELNEEQIKEFSDALDDKTNMEEKISKITVSVPGLMAKVEDAVEQEFLNLRSAKEKIS